MTDYCASSDIVQNMKGITFGVTTSVTLAALEAMIAQESAIIDQHILPRYTLPISDASALLFLQKIAIDLVVYRVTKVLQPKTAAPIPDDKAAQDISHASAWRAAMKMLGQIMSGEMTLPGEDSKPVNFFGSAAVDDDDQAEFQAGLKQW